MMLKVGLVQASTGIDPEANARALEASVARLADQGAEIVFTPEMSGLLDRQTDRLLRNTGEEASDPTLAALRALAAKCRISVALGSIAVRLPNGRLANRSLVIDSAGAIAARYDKLHLFDVDLPNGERYRESASFEPGTAASLANFDWGRLGLTICYDVRFPALYAALARAGAAVIACPAAFTVPTGTAHWHVLLRARAIETGAFLIAAAQTGRHEDGRETFGHSLVVGPWGDVLLDMGEAPGEAVVTLDLGEVERARARIPNLRHARPIPVPEIGIAEAIAEPAA
jgi:predicted amidohydrolase